MGVQDKEEDEHDKDQIYLEVELELDDKAKEDDIYELHLEPIRYFLSKDMVTSTYPSRVLSKNIHTISWYTMSAMLRIRL